MRLPTDRQVLEVVYRRYYSTFAQFSREGDGRETKVHVPIDVASIAAEFGVDADIIFGRLYYHLEQRYGYEGSGKIHVPFFSLQVGSDRHCVNFPLLASVLASMRTEHLRFRLATTLSIISIIISATALAVSLLVNLLGRPSQAKVHQPAEVSPSAIVTERLTSGLSGPASPAAHPPR